MRRILSLASAFLVPLIAPPVSAQEPKFDFATEARSFLAANGQPTTADQIFEDFLDSSAFVRVELGAFDLRMPVLALQDKVLVNRLKSAAQTLIEVQRTWHGWLVTGPEFDAIDADLAMLGTWVKGWSRRKLAGCEGGEQSLFEQLGARDKVLASAERLVAVTQYPEDTTRLPGANLTVLAPDREMHVKLAALGGLFDPSKEATLWHPSVLSQSAAWFDWVQIIGLENIAGVDWRHPYAGVAYTELDKTGLAQHVADRGAIMLLRKEYWSQGTHFFEESLATNLVIETVGKKGVHSEDWDYSYKRKGGSTKPYTRFIPGGNPAGGTLPKRKAKSGPTTHSGKSEESGHYLTTLGVEYYLDPVRKGQREGAKLALREKTHPLHTDKRPHFHLYSLQTHTSSYVSAPFLGRPAEDKILPGHEYLDDYEDFFRAYRSCFANWLKTRAGDSPEDSAARFASLLQHHASRGLEVDLDDIAVEVYGVPLSGEDELDGNLEWQFLAWLLAGK